MTVSVCNLLPVGIAGPRPSADSAHKALLLIPVEMAHRDLEPWQSNESTWDTKN